MASLWASVIVVGLLIVGLAVWIVGILVALAPCMANVSREGAWVIALDAGLVLVWCVVWVLVVVWTVVVG